SVSLEAPVQQDVTGTAVLSFQPDVPNPAITDNPQVQFCSGNASDPLCGSAQKDASGLLRIVPFTIPAGMQSVSLSPLLKSNVAGTIQISLNNLSLAGHTLTTAMLTVTIPRTPPEFLSNLQVSTSGQTL